MFMSYRFRIYPDKKQSSVIEQLFTETRSAYNYLVEQYISEMQNSHQNHKHDFEAVRKLAGKFPKLHTTSPSIIKHTISRFNFSLARSRALNKNLQFYHDDSHRSFCLTTRTRADSMFKERDKSRADIYPIGNIKARLSRMPVGQVLNITLVQKRSGRYYVSILTNQPDHPIPNNPSDLSRPLTCVGVDMGIKHFLTQSDGRKTENPKYFEQTLRHISRQQRNLKRKQKGSANYHKQNQRIARIYERIHNQRMGFIHRESTRMIRTYDIIVVENLAVKELLAQKRLSLRLNDAAWRKFINMLKYKAQWHGKTIIQVDRYYPSTKTCCRCRYHQKELKLEEREWTCPQCGLLHDRDTNAAINILQEGVRKYLKEYPETRHRLIPVLSEKR